ncbi:JHY protein, partial [Rhinopomastus cyanomelas]|nr:JHY protein [Rhinopomastus cyanomelas]
DLKLGGLGPDYEAMKEKKEKLKQQKEYSQQVKEHNMKKISSVATLPATQPQPPPGPRHKALEYAKTISRPKTITVRKPNGKVKEKTILPQNFDGEIPLLHAPQIPSLENLASRHEKEKEIADGLTKLYL